MVHTDITAGFIVWIVTTQCVNFAFYLALTRVVRGWLHTLGAYMLYFAVLAVVFPMTPLLHGGAQGAAGALSISFISFYVLWCALAVLMSGGALGRRLFGVVLCGIHQLIAFAVSLLLLRHVQSDVLGPLLASGVMAAMGWFMTAWSIPRIARMPDNADWAQLDSLSIAIFVLLYADSLWPIYIATEPASHTILFAIAAVVAIAFFPAALSFSEKNRLASSLTTVEDNIRLMAKEMASRREVIAKARQIWNDRRGRRDTLIGLLRQDKVPEALAYLEGLSDSDDEIIPLAESIWCENETINAIFSGYSRKAAAAGIHFSAMASVNEQESLPELEMVEMLSNLLEIAIRTTSANGDITCLLRQHADSFGVTVANTIPPEFQLTDEGYPANKSEPCLENALALVAKHHGECRYHLAHGQLVCDALLAVKA